jgi:uncharacterized membrane protein YcjF (UPF0283 family)
MASEQENQQNEPLNPSENETNKNLESTENSTEENTENKSDTEQTELADQTVESAQESTTEQTEQTEQTQTPKKKNIRKIALIGGGVLLMICLVLVGFFFGKSTTKKNEHEVNTTKKIDANITKKPKYVFEPEHINDLRLNLKLSILNKTELTPEQMAKLLSQADSNETMIYDKETMKLIALEQTINLNENQNESNATKDDANNTSKVQSTKPQLFIQVAYVKSENIKLPKIDSQKYGAKVSICKDSKHMAQIIIGPFENEKDQKKSLGEVRKIKQFNDAFTTKFTQEEYEKKCSF